MNISLSVVEIDLRGEDVGTKELVKCSRCSEESFKLCNYSNVKGIVVKCDNCNKSYTILPVELNIEEEIDEEASD